jgi:hypothetical protein
MKNLLRKITLDRDLFAQSDEVTGYLVFIYMNTNEHS